MNIFRFIGISLLSLSLLAGIALLLLPLGVLQRIGIFLSEPESALWLFFLLGLAVGLTLFALGGENRSTGKLSKAAGSVLLLLGLASAIVIFLVEANLLKANSTISLWWLFVTCNLLGATGVHIAGRIANRIKDEAETASRAAESNPVD